MAKKKKETAISPENDPAILKMTDVELLKLKLKESEWKRYALEASLKLYAKLDYIRQIDPQNKMGDFDRDMREFAKQSGAFKEEFNSVLKEIGDRLAINFDEYSYDDETGMIIANPET